MQWQGHVADFVQEQRATASQLDTALARFVGAGKGAFLMSEDFGFQKFRRNCRTIHRYKPSTPPRSGMNGTRNKFLAGAGFAEHQNACRCLGNNFNQFFQFFGRRGLANDDLVYRAARHNTHPPKQRNKR